MQIDGLIAEFDKQIQQLIDKGYPSTEHLQALKEKLIFVTESAIDFERGHLPFVIVIKHTVVQTTTAMSKIEKEGKYGITKLDPLQPTDFQVIQEEKIPDTTAYLLTDIDRGQEYLNVTPHVALQLISKKDRHPLTIDEGVAIVTHYPEFLTKNNCFSLLASRHSGDKRVPALWINGQKHPNLGWCWEGNPHTWLGSASCKKRLG